MRKGRFDEIFFVDLPSAEVRGQILQIHLVARDQAVDGFELDEVVAATEGFSGAELEQVIVAAPYAAHAQGTAMSTSHLLVEAENTRPLSVVMAERIDTLRRWAAGRTVAAG